MAQARGKRGGVAGACRDLYELPVGATTYNRTPGSSSFFFHFLHELQGEQLMVEDTGKALGCRRRILDELGLYDARIMGGADMVIGLSAIGAQQVGIELECMNEAEAAHFNEWAGAFHRVVDGQVGYVKGDLMSLWHGTIRDRRYVRSRDGRVLLEVAGPE